MKKELTKIEEKKILRKMHLKESHKRSLKEQSDGDHNEQALRDAGYDDFINDFTQYFNDLSTAINKPIEIEGEEPYVSDFPLDDYWFDENYTDEEEKSDRPVPTLSIDGVLYDILIYGWQYGSNAWYPILYRNGMGKCWDKLIQKYGGEPYRAGIWYFYNVGYEH